MNILLTCPPMIKQLKILQPEILKYRFNIHVPNFTAVMSEKELLNIIADYDGWIIGDDQVTENIIKKGKSGKLKALVKWGVGIDNVDFNLCKKYNIPVSNTPAMFGEEVSDIAINYLLTLSRQTHRINEEVRKGNWFKPTGKSLTGKKVALIGFGDIGRAISRKCITFNLNLFISDPGFTQDKQTKKISCIYNTNIQINDNFNNNVTISNTLGECLINADFIIVSCALNKYTNKMINKEKLLLANKGVILINIARGPIVVEKDVIELLESQHIESVGFDVFEKEPLDINNKLLNFKQNIYGSHNSSNTKEAVIKTSKLVLKNMKLQLNYETTT